MAGSVEVIVKQSGRPDRVVPLRDGTSRMGRAEDSEIVLSDVGVSRRHARIIVNGDSVRVEDLGSGNGTFVRGQRVDRQPLRDGDEVVIDPFVIQIRKVGRHLGEHTPQVPLRGRLDVVTGPDLAHSTYPIPARGLTIGRSDTRDVVIPDPAGSRHHCSIFLQQRVHVLRDMGSANGVYVNGQRTDECTLSNGDIITIGNTELRYVSDEAALGADAPAAARSRPTAPRSDMLSWLFVGATILVVGLLAALAVASVVVFRGESPPQVTTLSSGPPEWSLTLSEAPTETDPVVLSRTGIERVSAGDDAGALEQFWLLLRERPGYEPGEVFAYAAGEHLIVDAMHPIVRSEADDKAAYRAERDALLEQNTRASRRTLERDFGQDPAVRAALGLGPTALHTELQGQLTRATEAAGAHRCADAIPLFDEVLVGAQDESLKQSAKSGRTLCLRELAREVHTSWTQGVRAHAEGDVDTAVAAFEAVLAIDPGNPSAKLRLELLK